MQIISIRGIGRQTCWFDLMCVSVRGVGISIELSRHFENCDIFVHRSLKTFGSWRKIEGRKSVKIKVSRVSQKSFWAMLARSWVVLAHVGAMLRHLWQQDGDQEP